MTQETHSEQPETLDNTICTLLRQCGDHTPKQMLAQLKDGGWDLSLDLLLCHFDRLCASGAVRRVNRHYRVNY